MSIESGTRPSTSGSAIRLSLAQSRATNTRSETSSGHRRFSSASGMKAYSTGSGASPTRPITLSLPSRSNATLAASSEPSASPSGFSCVVSRKRSCSRIACATAERSLAVVWGELIDQLRHPDPSLDGRIVLERQLRGPLEPELAGDLGLEHGVRGLERLECLHALPLDSENGDEHASMAKVGRGFDAGDGDEADPRVLQAPDGLGENLLDGLVDSAHA